MKVLKLSVMILMMTTLVFFGMSQSQTHAEEAMTNAELVNTLFAILDLEFPDADEMTDEELFAAQVTMLASRGITRFVGASRTQQVTRGAVAEVVYAAVSTTGGVPAGAATPTSTQAKIDVLADMGFMEGGDEDDSMSVDEVVAVFSAPVVTDAVADSFSETPSDEGTDEGGDEGGDEEGEDEGDEGDDETPPPADEPESTEEPPVS
ncbi:MAG: hypothetical protein KKH94_04930 [Candidatus Omnitrophica bacterium]|nr:hypothetical protein [Candidatus Omnitrophota bacterium]